MRDFELTLDTEEDLTQIWLYTYDTWGFEQAEKYFDLIVKCCEAIGSGKAHSKLFKELQEKIHVHKCEEHYIFFMPSDRPIIIAILHGRMDFIQKLAGRL